jgi:hypothetical protein
LQATVPTPKAAIELSRKPTRSGSLKGNVSPNLRNSVIITAEQMKSLFGNVELIHRLHRDLLDQLEKALKSQLEPQSHKSVPEVFVSVFDETKHSIYVDYINNYDNADHTLNQLNENPNFVNFMEVSTSQSYTIFKIAISISI